MARPPWIDLPEDLTEKILERLPLLDYIRISAVHPKWRSIQRDHRSRRFPFLPLPWVIPTPFCCRLQNPLRGVSPLEKKSYSLPVHPATSGTGEDGCICLRSSHGWLLLLAEQEAHVTISFLNPITGAQILLPPLPMVGPGHSFVSSVSAPPTSPDCVVLLSNYWDCWLFRFADGSSAAWTSNLNIDPDFEPFAFAYSEGKFYGGACPDLVVIDPYRTEPIIEYVNLSWEQEPGDDSEKATFGHMLESDGDVLMVATTKHFNGRVKGFQVYKADLLEKKWITVKCLDERALFLSNRNSFSLSAADTGVRGNCIYSTNPLGVYYVWNVESWWQVFDLGMGRMTDGDVLDATSERHVLHFPDNGRSWFVPSQE